VGDDERFSTFASRAEHRDELDAIVAGWIGSRSCAEVLAEFERAEAAIAPVYTMRDLQADPHVRARHVFVEVDGVVQQGAVARMTRTPARLRFAGRPLGADTDDVLRELGLG
jgi:crotonobetainyl-CoA:carnitine CoA-transferase CaiB-like acyl-CoA transferase